MERTLIYSTEPSFPSYFVSHSVRDFSMILRMETPSILDMSRTFLTMFLSQMKLNLV